MVGLRGHYAGKVVEHHSGMTISSTSIREVLQMERDGALGYIKDVAMNPRALVGMLYPD